MYSDYPWGGSQICLRIPVLVLGALLPEASTCIIIEAIIIMFIMSGQAHNDSLSTQGRAAELYPAQNGWSDHMDQDESQGG